MLGSGHFANLRAAAGNRNKLDVHGDQAAQAALGGLSVVRMTLGAPDAAEQQALAKAGVVVDVLPVAAP